MSEQRSKQKEKIFFPDIILEESGYGTSMVLGPFATRISCEIYYGLQPGQGGA